MKMKIKIKIKMRTTKMKSTVTTTHRLLLSACLLQKCRAQPVVRGSWVASHRAEAPRSSPSRRRPSPHKVGVLVQHLLLLVFAAEGGEACMCIRNNSLCIDFVCYFIPGGQ